MKLRSQNIPALRFMLILVLIIQACATSENTRGSGDARKYSVDFERTKQVVEQAIRESNLNIDYVSESENKNLITLTVSSDVYINNTSVQQEQGTVKVQKNSDSKTKVIVENPEYHFSVPDHQRKDYQRIIFLRIDKLLENE